MDTFLLIGLSFVFRVTMVTADCNPRCQWITWNPWNECSQTCGGGYRTRTRPLCCDVTLDFAQCRTSCGLDDSPSFESDNQCNAICYNSATWSGSRCSCSMAYYGACCESAITCGTPNSLTNGQYSGSDFTYGAQITYTCNSGYGMLNGQEIHTCRRYSEWSSTAYWDGNVPQCFDMETCRSNPCENGGECINGYGEYTCTCSEGYTGDHCQFDIQPPIFTNCSVNRTEYTDQNSKTVSWTIPIFEDPFGNEVFVTSNYEGDSHLFPIGEYVVQYVGEKLNNGMRSECLFAIKVLRKSYNPNEDGLP